MGEWLRMFGNYMDFIEKNMDISALKRNVTADNIANFNTPNFKSSEVSFDHMFEKGGSIGLKQTGSNHLMENNDKSSPSVFANIGAKERSDGNNVDLNVEMVEMIKNNSYYSKSVQAMNKELLLNKLAIGN